LAPLRRQLSGASNDVGTNSTDADRRSHFAGWSHAIPGFDAFSPKAEVQATLGLTSVERNEHHYFS
jgi:hypothetical protein